MEYLGVTNIKKRITRYIDKADGGSEIKVKAESKEKTDDVSQSNNALHFSYKNSSTSSAGNTFAPVSNVSAEITTNNSVNGKQKLIQTDKRQFTVSADDAAHMFSEKLSPLLFSNPVMSEVADSKSNKDVQRKKKKKRKNKGKR